MLEFLRWVAVSERTYAEAMEAWQTSCPRSSVWEDSSIAGYVELRRSGADTVVVLSDSGRALLAET